MTGLKEAKAVGLVEDGHHLSTGFPIFTSYSVKSVFRELFSKPIGLEEEDLLHSKQVWVEGAYGLDHKVGSVRPAVGTVVGQAVANVERHDLQDRSGSKCGVIFGLRDSDSRS